MSTPPVSPLPLRLMNMRRCDSVSSSSLSSISSDDGEDLTRNSFHAMVLELMQSIEEKNKVVFCFSCLICPLIDVFLPTQESRQGPI